MFHKGIVNLLKIATRRLSLEEIWGCMRGENTGGRASTKPYIVLSLLHKRAIFCIKLTMPLARHGIEVSDETLIADLEFLRELELINLVGDASGGYYTLAIPLMGAWIDKQQDFAM